MNILVVALFKIINDPSLAQEHILLMVYGPEAKTEDLREGSLIILSPPTRQIIFFQVPVITSDSLYLRIFDADCGGVLDSRHGIFDTKTLFQLFGGDSAYSAPTLKNPSPSDKYVRKGVLIDSEYFGSSSFQDNKWHNFSYFSPSSGEINNGNYVFKLIIEGVSGNDENAFDVAVSLSDERNRPPDGLKMFSYKPTMRLPRKGVSAEMRFFVPSSIEDVTVHNFDLASATVGVETAFRSNLAVVSSGQDEWAKSKIRLKKNERGKVNAVMFQGGREMPNDATFYVTNAQDRAIPIRLPIIAQPPNSRPVPHVDLKIHADSFNTDCLTVIFDGAGSTDKDGHLLDFTWDFGDGHTGKGVRTDHPYDTTGTFDAEVVVKDNSGQVGNSSYKSFKVVVNAAPKAEAGDSLIAAPDQTLSFDGSDSRDTDGQLISYFWDFGDGSQGEEMIEGVTQTHVYKNPGFYRVLLRVEDNSKDSVHASGKPTSPCYYDIDHFSIHMIPQALLMLKWS